MKTKFMNNQQSYAYSTNEEDYQGDYASLEEAVEVGFDENPDEETIWAGEAVKPRLGDHSSAISILEDITEDPETFGGDWCGNWIADLFKAKAAIAELDETLTRVINEWADKHGLQPDFFNIERAHSFSREGYKEELAALTPTP